MKYDSKTDMSDTDLPDHVDLIVTEVVHRLVDRCIKFRMTDYSTDANEVTSEYMESAGMDTVFDVIETGPLSRDEYVATYITPTDDEGEPYYSFEMGVRYHAANNLQHMVLDRLDRMTGRKADE